MITLRVTNRMAFPVPQILFCSGVWSYIVASVATPTFILVRLLTWFVLLIIFLTWLFKISDLAACTCAWQLRHCCT